jgi:chromosome transmission fidelity protein 4
MILFVSRDTAVKLVNLIDASQIKLLKGQPTTCKNIAYDPFGAYVAVSGCDGNLRIWDSLAASTAAPIATLPLLPKVSIESENRLKVSWSSNGRYLAVPSSKGAVVLRRPTWEKCFTLDENIEGDVSVLSFSPNGNYIACASMGSFKVLVFSIDSQECIGYMDGKGHICSINWSQSQNSLICSNSIGHVFRWNNVIPSHMSMPFDTKNSSKKISLDENEENEDADIEKPKRKKLKKASELLKEAEETQENEVWSDDDLDHMYEKYDSDSGYLSYDDDRKRSKKVAPRLAKSEIQSAFQPGSTPLAAVNAKRLLAWNLLGSIESQKLETHSLIHIQFSDVSFHQPIRFKDHFGFEIAAFGQHGAVFTSKKSDSGTASTLFYKPFDSWTTNTEWRVQLGKEQADSVAIGNKWLVLVTDLNYVRIFSLGGRQMSVFQINGPVLTCCASGNLFAVVHHCGESFEGFQNLCCIVYDIEAKKKIYQGSLPLSRKHELTWLGFSENNVK